jgi:hypothetical protein
VIPIPVNHDGVDFAVTGSFHRGEFRAVSVRVDGTEVLPLLAVTGRLRDIEIFAEWELKTAPV